MGLRQRPRPQKLPGRIKPLVSSPPAPGATSLQPSSAAEGTTCLSPVQGWVLRTPQSPLPALPGDPGGHPRPTTLYRPFLLIQKPSSAPERGPAPYLAADASCNVSHLDPVELPDVQVFTIERLYLDFHT